MPERFEKTIQVKALKKPELERVITSTLDELLATEIRPYADSLLNLIQRTPELAGKKSIRKIVMDMKRDLAAFPNISTLRVAEALQDSILRSKALAHMATRRNAQPMLAALADFIAQEKKAPQETDGDGPLSIAA